jgi:hypothetical protein
VQTSWLREYISLTEDLRDLPGSLQANLGIMHHIRRRTFLSA